MRKHCLSVVSIALLATGCSSAPKYTERSYDVLASGGLRNSRVVLQKQTRSPGEFFASGSEQCVAPGESNVANLQRDFVETLAACNERLSSYEDKASQAKWLKFSLATAGGIAGSIVVPALAAKAVVSKTAIAAWGGFSGATNLLQESLSAESLAPSDFLATRQTIRLDLKRAIEKYTNPTADHCVRMLAVSEMAAACVAFEISMPAEAQKAARQK